MFFGSLFTNIDSLFSLAVKTFYLLDDPLDDTDRIFVSIAAYRDSECSHTIRDLFDKARFPHRLFVGVLWQYDETTDPSSCILPGNILRFVCYPFT
jgi:Glycosyltransferase (GlcNAc)